jgi:hypothetical protein
MAGFSISHQDWIKWRDGFYQTRKAPCHLGVAFLECHKLLNPVVYFATDNAEAERLIQEIYVVYTARKPKAA